MIYSPAPIEVAPISTDHLPTASISFLALQEIDSTFKKTGQFVKRPSKPSQPTKPFIPPTRSSGRSKQKATLSPSEQTPSDTTFFDLEARILRNGFIAHAVPEDMEQPWYKSEGLFSPARYYKYMIVVHTADDNLTRTYLADITGLEALANEEDEVILLEGFIDWRERFRAFASASLVIVPSRFEPFGLIVLEAMQAEVPVLYAENAGAHEVLSSGITIDPSDANSTAKKIVELLGDKEERKKIIEAQRTEISSYAQRGYERELIKLWEEISTRHR